jgi:hypothetical protein
LTVSFLAGTIGSLTGLGGGIIITPVLVILFHFDLHFAMGASLIAVIATSTGSSTAYLDKGYSNIRIGLLLETTAVAGAMLGALLIPFISKAYLSFLFSILLFLSAYLALKRREDLENWKTSHSWSKALRLNGSYSNGQQLKTYHVQNVPIGLFTMLFAGVLSGLLGIGSGILKVLTMDYALRLPYRVATTTSNFMIGITAATSASIYFAHGYVNPTITCPVVIGVFIGAYAGTQLLPLLRIIQLRIIFVILILLMGIQMLVQALHTLYGST